MQINNLFNNPNIEILEQHPYGVQILQYKQDLSVTPGSAAAAYFSEKMNARKRQAVLSLSGNSWTLSAGAMQWMCGNVEVKTDIKGVGDLVGKVFSSKVTGEAPVKPVYYGNGLVMLEPSYKHLLIESLQDWGGSIVMQDGMYLASSGDCRISTSMISSLSGAIAGGEGLFNTMVQGPGVVVLESPNPRGELIEFYLENDVLKIDGSYAVAWSPQLQFTVERTTKTLIGSAASGEGLVNVYRGTGKVLMAPV